MSKRQKILMLTTQLGYGGAETSFIRLANMLAVDMDVTVALFTSEYGMESYAKGHEQLNTAITLLDIPGEGRLRRWVRRICTLRVLKRQHDVTISFLSGPNLVNVLAGSNAGSVVSLRGSRVYDPVAPAHQRLIFQYFLDPIIFQLAARIVPVSDGLRNEISKIAQQKIRVIPPFIDVNVLEDKRHEPASVAYRPLQGQPVIVAVGRLSVEKGFHHLIRVCAKLPQGTKLLLVGDGPMQPQLRAQCSVLNIAVDNITAGISSVIFAGYQKNILPLMKLGRALALTSATEGFPSVLLEAMVAGVPVLAADTPWGARTTLGAESTSQPYPTTQPTTVIYGVLMPRIDLPEYEATWISSLETYLRGEVAINEQADSRPADFNGAVIGAQWKKLIEELAA